MPNNPVAQLRSSLQQDLRQLAEEISADAVTSLLYDVQTDEFDLPLEHGLRFPEYFTDPAMYPGTDRLAGRVVKNMESIVPIDIPVRSAVGTAFARREEISSAAVFPLVHKNVAVGILFVNFRSTHEFTNDEIARIEAFADMVARRILDSDVLSNLRQERVSLPLGPEDRILWATARLVTQVLDCPAAIWLENPHGEYRVRAVSALRQLYLRQGIAGPDDGSLVSNAIGTGKSQSLAPLEQGPLFPYQPEAFAAGWKTSLALPIVQQRKPIGVIEIFGLLDSELDRADLRTLDRISEMAAEVAATSSASSSRSRRMVEIAKEISGADDLSLALQILVDGTTELTGAHSAVFIRRLADDHGFSRVVCSERVPSGYRAQPPVTDSFLEKVHSGTETCVISDTNEDKAVQGDISHHGINSLVAIPVRGVSAPIGVLLVNGFRPNQFREPDIQIIETLVAQISTASLGASWIFDPSQEIEQATSRFFGLGDVLDDCLEQILNEYGFDFVAVQLIRRRDRVIETVRAKGKGATELAGLARHSLDADDRVRDIQAHIANYYPPKIEIIVGWDDRFDDWIYEQYRHKDMVRVWVPMLILRRTDGTIDETWPERYRWREVDRKVDDKGSRVTLEMELKGLDAKGGSPIEVVGTVEAGVRNPEADISIEQATGLVGLVGCLAPKIRSHLLISSLETTARGAAEVVRADAASLHFAFDQRRERYAYDACSSGDILCYLEEQPEPAFHKLARRALKGGKPAFLPNPHASSSLQEELPKLAALGIEWVVAFPSVVEDQRGVLYLYFRSYRHLTEDEVKWVSSFCDRAASATRHVTQQIKLHDHVRRLDTLHAVTHALVREPQRPDLLRAVAGYTRNLIAADVVVIYEYLSSDKRFPSKPTVVGRLIAPRKALIPKSGDFLPLRLAEHDEDVYAPEPSSHPVLNGSKFGGFIAREGIESVAAVQLCEGEDVVGVMFINYRTRQRFSERTRTIVRVLADTAALAIKTGGTYRRFMFDLSRRTREMAALLSVDREIVRGHQDKARPDTARVFKLILEKALELTGADAGYIMGFDGIKTLDLKAGIGLPDDQSHLSHELGWGIVGLAAHERKSIRVPDVTLEPWKQYYLSVIPDTRSELAVPLRAHDGLIGVINLESKEKDHFSEDDKRLVDTLAAQAVISVHSVAVYLQLDRQIAPLKSLVHSVSRVQAAGTNLDRLLRVLLTSVTAEQGLGFSRAMILLHDPSREALRGEIAIGAISQEEADSVWGNLRGMVSSSNPKSGFFDHLLDQAEALSEDVVDDPDRDSALSRAVKRLDLPLHSPGVICTCFRDASMPILVEEGKSDPFRQKLRELIGDGLTDKAEATYAFVVMPLVGHDACFGVLVVDNRYRYPVVGIESDDMDRLEIFGSFIALSIEGMRIQRERERRKDQEREKNVRAVVEKNVFHTVNSQVAVFEVYKEHIEEMLFNHRQSIPETLYQELSEIVTSIGT